MKKISKTELRKLIKEQTGGSRGTLNADILLFDAVQDYVSAKEAEIGYGTSLRTLKHSCMAVVEEAFNELEGVGYGPGGY